MPPLPKSRHKDVLKLWPAAFTPPPDFKLTRGTLNPTRTRWLDALQEESTIEPLLLVGAKLNIEPKELASTVTFLGQVNLKPASVAAGPRLRGGRRVRCPNEARANRIRVKEHYEREQKAKKAAREDRKPWVDPRDGDIQTISADELEHHADFKIAQGVANKFRKKYCYSDYDDLLQKANVVLLDEKEYAPVGHENRPKSIEKTIERRLSSHCIKESRRRQIFEQPPQQPTGDDFESWIDWTDCAAVRWSPRPERASRVTAILRMGELTRKDWQIWKLLAAGKTHVAIASALGLSSHDVVYHTKEKIKALLLRRQPDKPASSPPASSHTSKCYCGCAGKFDPSEPRAAAICYGSYQPFERARIDARRLRPSRGDVRAGHASGISAVAHTPHCIEGDLTSTTEGVDGARTKSRIDALGLQFVEIRHFSDSTHPEVFTSIWELRPKSIG